MRVRPGALTISVSWQVPRPGDRPPTLLSVSPKCVEVQRIWFTSPPSPSPSLARADSLAFV